MHHSGRDVWLYQSDHRIYNRTDRADSGKIVDLAGSFAPKLHNAAAAVSLKGKLDNLNAEKRALLKGVFSSAENSDSATPPAAQE